MTIVRRKDPISGAVPPPETPGLLKEYRRPEFRRYGRVSRVVSGGSGNAGEGAPKGKKSPRP